MERAATERAPAGLVANVVEHDFVLAHLEAVRGRLDAAARPARGSDDDAATAALREQVTPEEAEAALSALELASRAHPTALREPALGDASADDHAALNKHAFVCRHPALSVLQSAIEERIEKRHGHRIEPVAAVDPSSRALAATRAVAPSDDERMGAAFTTDDPMWEVEIAKAMVERIVRCGRRPFNPRPAPERGIANDTRLVVFGDWATGLDRALSVTRQARQWIREAADAGREVHAIHLGDVYYSGEKHEYDRRLLAPGLWPVEPGEAEAIGSWSLNGNHDMYSGGWDYFDHLLADDRFQRQRSGDEGTSWFDLASRDWRVIGLDTAWHDRPLTHPDWGDLQPPQGEYVVRAAQAADGRKLLLLSHHQLFSVYDRACGPTLERELAPALESGRVRAWLWGHEHRCVAYAPHMGVEFPRCIGHAGMPEIAHPPSAPLPAPAQWEYRGQFESHGRAWTLFGFAVLDFDGPAIRVSYVNEDGGVDRTEEIA